MGSTSAAARKVDIGSAKLSSAHEVGIDALMRELVFKKPSEGGLETAAPAETMTEKQAPRRDFDMTTEILDRAGQAFDLLINRCQILEQALDDANERAQVQTTEQEETIEQWKQIATQLKAQLETTEQTLNSLRTRCDAVQTRAVKAEETVKALEAAAAQAASHAALAEGLSTKLHDKVVSAFGIGSRAHPFLEAVATRVAAE